MMMISFMKIQVSLNGEGKRKRLIAEHSCPCRSPWTGSASSLVRPFTRVASKEQMSRLSTYFSYSISLEKVGKLFFFFFLSPIKLIEIRWEKKTEQEFFLVYQMDAQSLEDQEWFCLV